MIDWNKDLEFKVWGWDYTGDGFDHDWMTVIRFEKNTDGNYSVWDEPDTEEYWGNVQKDGIVLRGNKQIGEVRNKKPDNRAVFYFERKGDTYTLTGWKNVMTIEDIREKHGQRVLNSYWNAMEGYYFYDDNENRICYIGIGYIGRVLDRKHAIIGTTLCKDEYKYFVDSTKMAGEKLSKLVRDSKKPEKIEVKI